MQLTHFTTGITGNIEIAREIVQEAFMRFWKADERKIAPELERAWLFRVCRNLAIDQKRRQGKVIAVGDTQELENLAALGSRNGPDPENDEPIVEVLSHLKKLSNNQQEILRLRYQAELSYKEIAEITGQSVSNVGVIIHEAMKKLKLYVLGKEPSAKASGEKT